MAIKVFQLLKGGRVMSHVFENILTKAFQKHMTTLFVAVEKNLIAIRKIVMVGW